MKAAQEPPKITLKFGQRQNASTGVNVDQETLTRQQNLVRGATTSQGLNNSSQAPNQSHIPGSLPSAQGSQERVSAGPAEQGVNGVKREVSHGHSPALGKVQPNGTGTSTLTMPPPLNHAQNSYGSPNLAATNGTPYGVTSHHSVPKNPTYQRVEGKNASDAIIMNLNICTHPDLRDLPQKFNLDIPASDAKTQQSVTISLSRRQWRLLIRPTLSPSLLHRPSRTFVTCNNRRVQALAQPELDQRRPIFEHKTNPGHKYNRGGSHCRDAKRSTKDREMDQKLRSKSSSSSHTTSNEWTLPFQMSQHGVGWRVGPVRYDLLVIKSIVKRDN